MTVSSSACGPPGTGQLVDLPTTVYQSTADVLQRHGAYILTDSACDPVEPRVTSDLPPNHRGLVTRSRDGKDFGRPTGLSVHERLPRDVRCAYRSP
ncbi:hypothetical protein R75461_05847 [Paraburkholderia nemoris]|nr:hypothetical protein R75461_05847 [Paraburkholderia nemoris]